MTTAQGYVQRLNQACQHRHELGMPVYSFSDAESSAPTTSAQAMGPFICKCEVAIHACATNAPRSLELRQQGRAATKKGAKRAAAKLVLDQYANITSQSDNPAAALAAWAGSTRTDGETKYATCTDAAER